MNVIKCADVRSIVKRMACCAVLLAFLVGLTPHSTPVSYGRVAVTPPTLLSPADGIETTGDPHDADTSRILYEPLGVPLFVWEPAAGVTRYCFQISSLADFSADVVVNTNDLGYAGYAPTSGEPNDWKKDSMNVQHPLEHQKYYWRVGSYDPATGCNWSEVRSFTRHWGMKPKQLYPLDSSTNTFLQFNPVFEWTPTPGAAFYHLQVSGSPDFGTIALNDLSRQTSLAPHLMIKEGILDNDTDYYWRVRAFSYGGNQLNVTTGAPSDWSCSSELRDCPRFRIRWSYYQADTKIDYRPQPLTPVNNATNVGFPLFSWTPVKYATRYEINVCADSLCQTIIYKQTTGDAPPSTSWVYNLNDRWTSLQPNTEYFWRVRACVMECQDGFMISQWSNEAPATTFRFKTGPEPTITPSLFYPPYYYDPSITDLDEGNFEDRTIAVPAFMWDHVYGAITYTLQVADAKNDPNFTNPLWQVKTRNLNVVPTSSVPITQGLFLWRVSADGVNWSQYWKTRVDAGLLGGATPADQPVQLLRPDGRPAADGDTYGYESVDTFPLLEWRPVQAAGKYHIQIARDAGFKDVVDETDTLFTNYTPVAYCPPVYPSQPGCRLGWGTYYWRVRALGASGTPLAGGYSQPYRFLVSKPLRFILDHTATQVGPFERALLATDSLSDTTDSAREVGNLYVGVDRLYWLLGFEAQPAETPGEYMLLLDINHADGVGASSPPGISSITTTLPHQPEFAIKAVFSQATTIFTPTLYTWSESNQEWDVGLEFDTYNLGTAVYNPVSKTAEIRLSRTAINDSPSVALSLFSPAAGGGVLDSVPESASSSYLWNFAAHSQSPTPVLPPTQVISGNVLARQTPVLMWHTMEDVWNVNVESNTGQGTYYGRVASDYGFSTIYKTGGELQDGYMPREMSFSAFNPSYIPNRETFEDNPLYYWDVAGVVEIRELANIIQVKLPYGQPGQFSVSMFAPLSPTVTPIFISDTITYTNDTPTFSWTPVQGARGYLLTIKKGGTSPVVIPGETPVETFHTTYRLRNSLSQGFYTWQVQTINQDKYLSQDMTGSASSFTIIYPEVTPKTPVRGSALDDPFTFSWERAEGAAFYELQADLTDQFASPSLDTYRTYNTYFVPPKILKALKNGKAFYWRVRMCKGDNVSCGAWTLRVFGYTSYLPIVVKNNTALTGLNHRR